jgi:hypothetical protein
MLTVISGIVVSPFRFVHFIIAGLDPASMLFLEKIDTQVNPA